MPSAQDTSLNGVSRFSTNTVLERDQSQWLFTQEELNRTPSILDGLPPAQELANRQKGVNFITQVGIMLKLPQLTLATASVYLHRFFMRHAMQQPGKAGLHHYSAAATSLFLATKVEENCRKMKELVVACCRVAQKQPNLVVDEQNKEYWKWRDTILQNEDLLLEALCFDLQLEQPYRILFEFLQYYGVQDNKILRNTSWAFLNDSHITTMCLLHSPRAIAGAALYAGVRLAGITLPDDESGSPWWEHLDLDVIEIQQACNRMFDVYENPALPRVGAKNAYPRENDMGSFESTRSYLSPRPEMSPSRSVRSTSAGIKRDRAEIEGDQSEEWGGPSQQPQAPDDLAPPSPKRKRVDTPEVPVPPQSASRIPPGANGSRIPPQARPPSQPNDVDDVQQRIDDIVNASSSSSNGHASLTSRPSSQQQLRGAAPPQRITDSAPNGQRQPASNNNGDSRTPVDKPLSSNGPNGKLSRHDSIDDAEKVDYGSEEGEV